MKIVHIKQKLEELGVSPEGVIMGDFDAIGEFTAKRTRSSDDPNYKKFGVFYRANYERMILVYNLIRQYNLTSMLEIGFGRGAATFAAAKAFHDAGVVGNIVTIDPKFDDRHMQMVQQVFPKEWFGFVKFAQGRSQDVLPTLTESFDLVYIDGDHSYAGTKLDWELTKDKCNKVILFDDYHLPTKEDAGIQCRTAIDEIDWASAGFGDPELIRMDRRMFVDERSYTDEQIDYGQVLALKAGVSTNEW